MSGLYMSNANALSSWLVQCYATRAPYVLVFGFSGFFVFLMAVLSVLAFIKKYQAAAFSANINVSFALPLLVLSCFTAAIAFGGTAVNLIDCANVFANNADQTTYLSSGSFSSSSSSNGRTQSLSGFCYSLVSDQTPSVNLYSPTGKLIFPLASAVTWLSNVRVLLAGHIFGFLSVVCMKAAVTHLNGQITTSLKKQD